MENGGSESWKIRKRMKGSLQNGKKGKKRRKLKRKLVGRSKINMHRGKCGKKINKRP